MFAQQYDLFPGIQKPEMNLISLDMLEYTISITLKLLAVKITGLYWFFMME